MKKWDKEIPENKNDVVELLERRIEVHQNWLDCLNTKDPAALEASKHGVGTVESHTIYIKQYQEAIKIIKWRNLEIL